APAEKYCYAWLSRLKDNYDLWPYFLLGKVLFLQEKMDDAYRMLQLVYTKFANDLDFGENIQKEKFMSELYYFYGACCVAKQNYKLGLKLLRRVRRKYYADSPGVDKLIEIAEQRLGGQSQTGTKVELPTISLCMIVRDAAANLDLCLSSVQKVVDEIVIVDTGSQDGTIEIARKYTDKIYHFKWCDDFAKARNESLKYATKDWILVLDDDEALRPESSARIKQFLAEQPAERNVYVVGICECKRTEAEKELLAGQECTSTYVHNVDRLIRNHQGLQYQNALHEIITEKDGGLAYASTLTLLHWGYNEGINQERYLRNFRIMQKELAAKPDDFLTQFNYTRAYSVWDGRAVPELLRNMDRTIDLYLKDDKAFCRMPLAEIYDDYTVILTNERQYAWAEKYCYAWLTRLKDNYDLMPYLRLGKILILAEKIDEAYRILKLVYEKSQNGIPFCAAQHLKGFKSDLYFFYGVACMRTGDYRLGVELMNIVKQEYITNNQVVDNLIEFAQEKVQKLPTISLCMIVRDAAANLDLCLSSVQKVVDEIVIVDTGSRDGTI
ncbi:glycosyl transferase group 2, partial [Candidatus Termititenax persephonae]